MTNPHDILEPYVADGTVPGAVGLLARGDRVEVQAVGSADLDGGAPMARDSIFRIASITKPITAAAVMLLVDDGRLALDDPVERWLRDVGELFLEGQGWGFGASVDVEATDPWNVLGRYGWVGGTGTTAHLVPSSGSVAILLTQVGATGPGAPALMRDFWRHAAQA